jgi:putative hydrolase of the HAD superfamily
MGAMRSTPRFDAVIFDAGGVLVLPDPAVIGPLLAYYGGDASVERQVRAHYAGMAAKSAAGSSEGFWEEYNLAYVESAGVPPEDQVLAAHVLGQTRSAYLWRWPIPDSVAALRELEERGVPIGVVSNASGFIEEVLDRSGVCQVGDGAACSMRVIVDSHHVGVMKPDPRIFDFALEHFAGIDRSRIAYVGDSVTMDVEGGRAAGLHPVLLDPYDDHEDDPTLDRIATLLDLLDRVDG